MKESFDKAFEFVIGAEGKLTDDPKDPGGLTKYGISQRAYPTKDIRNLTLEGAKEIYKFDYWINCGCDALEYPIDIIVFDTAVNMGCSVAKKLLREPGNEYPVSYLIRRAGEYGKLKKYPIYGKGWINRLVHLYETFLRF